jgi:hypothetical protein
MSLRFFSDILWDVVGDFQKLAGNEVEDIGKAVRNAKGEIERMVWGVRRQNAHAASRASSTPRRWMVFDHPDYFRQLRLTLETTFNFLLEGISTGMTVSFISTLGLTWYRLTTGGTVSTSAIFWTTGRRGGWLLFNFWLPFKESFSLGERPRADFNLHFQDSPNRPLLLLLGAVYILGFLLARLVLWPTMMELGARAVAILHQNPEWQPDFITFLALNSYMGKTAAIQLLSFKFIFAYLFGKGWVLEILQGIIFLLIVEPISAIQLLVARYYLCTYEGDLLEFIRSYITHGASFESWTGLWMATTIHSDHSGRIVSPVYTITKSSAYYLTRPFEMWVWKQKLQLFKSFLSLRPSSDDNLFQRRDYPPITDANMMRLLKLHPNGKGRIICTLETHSIDAAPPYWALSYVWGAPDMPVVIHIESRDRTAYLPITRSCTNAFTSLISSYQDRYVWIDSICIDQMNVIEKAQQIPLMSSIYSKAELVIGHISGETVGVAVTRPVGDFVSCLLQSNRVGLSWTIDKGGPFSRETEDIAVPRKLDFEQLGVSHAKADWDALVEIVNNAYWRRAWIIQEIVLAKNQLICCGISCFTFEELAKVSYLVRAFLVYPAQTSHYHAAAQRLRAFNTTIVAIKELKTKIQTPLQSRPMLAEIMDLWKPPIEATNPRDQIYAMLALSSDSHEVVFRPNYDTSLTYNEISTQVAAHYLQNGATLCFFYMAGISYRSVPTLGHPSWAPDLARRCEIRKRFWEASRPGECLKNVTFSPNGKTLSVRGFIFDEVRVVSSADKSPLQKWLKEQVSPDGRLRPYEVVDIIKQSKQITQNYVPDRYANGITKEEAYWRAMTFDRDPEGSPAAIASQILFKEDISWMMEGSDDITAIDKEFFTSQKVKRMVKRMGRTMPFVKLWAEYAFSVSKAGYMAWVPPEAKEGDVFCLFEDCDVPFLLRGVEGEDAFYLVGEAYLFGFAPEESRRSSQLIHII